MARLRITDNALILSCIVLFFALGASPSSGASTEDELGRELDRRLDAWGTYLLENPHLSDLTSNEHYQAIVDLGPPALPYLIEKVEGGAIMLADAVIRITGKRFHWSEWPAGELGGAKTHARLVLQWWPKARKETGERFAALYAQWRHAKEADNPELATERFNQLDRLGIAALPQVMAQIERGDEELIRLVAYITERRVAPDATRAECLAWWQENREKWLIPFPNARPVAKAGPNRTVAAGATVKLDASASMDEDGDALSYRWVQVGGPTVELSDATGKNPTFVAPRVQGTTVLTFQLVVDDAGDLSRTVPTPNSRSKPTLVRITIDPQG